MSKPETETDPIPMTVTIAFTWDTPNTGANFAVGTCNMPCGQQNGPAAKYDITWVLTGATFDTDGVHFVLDPPTYKPWPSDQPTPVAGSSTQYQVAQHNNPWHNGTWKYRYNINVLYNGNPYKDDPVAEDEGESK